VVATDIDDVVTTIDHVITVIQDTDEMFCAVQLLVSTPTQTRAGDDNVMSAYIPSCMRTYLQSVTWDYGDSTSGTGETVHKTYSAAGDFTIKATLHLSHPQIPTINITRTIQVNAAPVDNNKCSADGQTRASTGDTYDETETCGVGGHKTVTYQDTKHETCQRVGDILDWVTTSVDKIKVSEGQCQGQSCPMPGSVPAGTAGVQLIDGVYYLADNATFSFYTQSSPAGLCQDNMETRRCSNGVLSGSGLPVTYQCHSGCGDFGPDGTVKIGVNVGTQQVAVQCSFGEQGVFDTYNQIEDRACSEGSVNSSNLRLGDLISHGQCPTYSYHPTGLYNSCSADCGGTQTMIYECRNNTGTVAAADRCAGQPYPVTSRVCDGNPGAVRRVESSSAEEQEPSASVCPKNQIGIIVNTRTSTTVNTYACIEHAVALESSVVESTPWLEERYCRDYVAHRCAQDSLNNTEAHRRYLWMKRCAPQNRVLADFLESFDEVSSGLGNIDGTGTGRTLYPTFLNSSSKPEKPWIAPIYENSSCTMPAGAYVAAVCVSSCALPQEKILAQRNPGARMGPVEFIKGLTDKYDRAATFTVNSSMNSRQLKNSKVEQWITELVDTEQPVLVFTMASGETLSVTPTHPILRVDGTMDTANNFKTGEALVKLGGVEDPIVSIERILYFGKVYNLFVKSAVPQENIVVTNGYLNGTAYFQNEGAADLNKDLVRKKLTRGIFGK
jgi:hypothetical protein